MKQDSAQKGGVIAWQQGFRVRLYLTCFSICADEGLTLEMPVSWGLHQNKVTSIPIFMQRPGN